MISSLGNEVSNYFTIFRKVEEIEERIAHEEVDLHERDTLFRELDDLREKATLIREFALPYLSSLQDLEQKIISLYGRVETLAYDHEFSQIKKETLHLETALGSGNLKQIALEIDEIKRHICFLKKNYRPTLSHRNILLLAERFVQKIPGVLQGKLSAMQLRQQFLLLKTAFEELPHLSADTMELFFAVCETAEDLYYGHMREYQRKLISLPESVQKKVRGLSKEDALQELFIYGNRLCEPATSVFPTSERETECWFGELESLSLN